jgi:hypothetical protein
MVWGEQKGPSIPRFAGLPSSLVIAAYFYVRLIPRNFGTPCCRSALPTYLKGLPGGRQDLFDQPVKKSFSVSC